MPNCRRRRLTVRAVGLHQGANAIEEQHRAPRRADRRLQRPLHPHRDVRAPQVGPGEGPRRFISGRPDNPMCELGWKILAEMLELTALPSIDEERAD